MFKKNDHGNIYIKYPRTPHIHFSPGISDDDQIIQNMENLQNTEIVVTEKMDGENITLYNDFFHARSINSNNHYSRDWLARFHSLYISHNIPDNWRICGEYLYAKHSIFYENLKSYFLGFSVWNEKNICISWDETIDLFKRLNIHSVPVLYRGKFNLKLIKEIEKSLDYEKSEGFVIRNSNSFHYNDFGINVCKYVRKNHIKTGKHWIYQKIIKNKLSGS